jgi:hypothetical protein
MFQVQTILPMPKLSNSAFQSDIKDGIVFRIFFFTEIHTRAISVTVLINLSMSGYVSLVLLFCSLV